MECKSSVRRNLHEGRSLNVRARKLARRCERANTERRSGVGCRVSARCEIRKRAAGFLRAGGKETPRCSSAMKAWVVFVFSSSFFFSFFF